MSTAPKAPEDGEQSGPPIGTVAGTGAEGFKGDNGPAVSAELNRPYGIAVDSNGAVYISDHENHRIRKITTDGRISTIVGTGMPRSKSDDGPAVSAQLNSPRGVATDRAGNLYIADTENHRVRKITPDGRIGTVAGKGTAGFSGDDGPATAALLDRPVGVTVDSTGTLYIADTNNHRIRKVTTDGRIGTVAGTGKAGFDGDGGPADAAQLNCPSGVAVDGAGNLYIADTENHLVRKVTADGKIRTVAGTGKAGFEGDGGPAASAQLDFPIGMVVDSTGGLFIADHGNHRVRRVAADGTISTVVGTGKAGFDGDGGPAASAELNSPIALAVDCVDTLYIADHVNNRVRKVAAAKMAGLPESGTVVSWANVRSKLRMGVVRESVKDGAEVHHLLAAPREHQRWRLVVVGEDNGDVHYMIENLRSGKVLEVPEALKVHGTVVGQRAYEGGDAHHQHWRLIPMSPATAAHRVYEIANRHSGLLLRVDTSTSTAIKQYRSEGDHRNRQWQLLPV